MASIGINDTLDAFYDLCVERGLPECPGRDYVGQCRDQGWTVRQLIEGAKADDADQGAGWCLWARLELADRLSYTVRTLLADVATRDDPRMAAHLDIYALRVTPTEREMLTSRWTAEELPNIARQLEEGIVQRGGG